MTSGVLSRLEKAAQSSHVQSIKEKYGLSGGADCQSQNYDILRNQFQLTEILVI